MSTRATIIDSAARTLWVNAYMEHVEGVDAEYPCSGEAPECPFGTHDRPGAGEDWFDFAPPTGAPAKFKAVQLVQAIERMNATEIEVAYERAASAPGERHRKHYKDPTPEDFGHCIAMQALGHGVAWSDNHPGHGLSWPHITFSEYDF